MRKKIFGRRLKRDTNERKALFRSLMYSFIMEGKIRTTEAKAKAIRSEVEKLVTHAKNKGEEARNVMLSTLPNDKAIEKLIKEIAPKFASRPGGYTRLLKVSPRVKDNAKMVLMTWTEEVVKTVKKEEKRNKNKKPTKPAKEVKETKKETKAKKAEKK